VGKRKKKRGNIIPGLEGRERGWHCDGVIWRDVGAGMKAHEPYTLTKLTSSSLNQGSCFQKGGGPEAKVGGGCFGKGEPLLSS